MENQSLFKIIIQMIQKFDETVKTHILIEKKCDNKDKTKNMEIDKGDKKT